MGPCLHFNPEAVHAYSLVSIRITGEDVSLSRPSSSSHSSADLFAFLSPQI
uniref:Uncharacterized protein n=1 Tax=Anguilla anguilla TaxID=7936 RepID=A0A0E9PTS1_ANGAN